jgi:hypothetical protein
MVRHGHGCADWYSANSPYVWSASAKGVPGQALMLIISIMIQVTTTSATWLGYAIAATLERLGGITAAKDKAKNHQNQKIVNRALTLTHASALGNLENGK